MEQIAGTFGGLRRLCRCPGPLARPSDHQATRPPAVLRDQPLQVETVYCVRQPFGQTQVQPTDGLRVIARHLGERAAPEHELHSTTVLGASWTRPALSKCHLEDTNPHVRPRRLRLGQHKSGNL